MNKNRFAHLSKLFGKATDEDEEKKDHQAIEDDEEKDEEAEEEERKESKAEDSDQDDEDEEKAEEEESPEAKKARKAENKRCAAIFASPHAANNVSMAAQLAFETRLSSKEAIGVLATAPLPSTLVALDDRMRGVKNPQVGSDASVQKDRSASTAMIDVYNKVKGKK